MNIENAFSLLYQRSTKNLNDFIKRYISRVVIFRFILVNILKAVKKKNNLQISLLFLLFLIDLYLKNIK